MFDGSWKARPSGLGFSTPLSPLLPAERPLLVAHLAQAGSHGLELRHLDFVDGRMVRQADRLMFFVAEDAAFELAGNRHCHSSTRVLENRASRPFGVVIVEGNPGVRLEARLALAAEHPDHDAQEHSDEDKKIDCPGHDYVPRDLRLPAI